QGRPSDLRRGARIAVATWIAVTVPLLAGESVWLLWNLPRLTRTLIDSVQDYARAIHAAALDHQWAQLTLAAVAVLLLVLPAIGRSGLAVRISGRAARLGAARAGALRPQPRGRHRR